MNETDRKEYLQRRPHNKLVEIIMKLEKQVDADAQTINDLRQESQETYESEQYFSGIVHGEVKDHKIECDVGPFFIKPRVMFDVCTEDETHVPDCTTYEQAERYCKQLNIEDRLGDGRIDMGGMTAQDYGEFITSNAPMLRDLITVLNDTKAYLDTVPVGEIDDE